MQTVSIASGTGMGAVEIAVTDADRALRFYRDYIGLTPLPSAGPELRMGAHGRELVVLNPGAERPVVAHTSGLYHLAILVPDRKELARVIGRLARLRWAQSPTDHVMTKANYLWDPDGNGIEIYTESPEDGFMGFANGTFAAWDKDGNPRSGRDPIDLEELFTHLSDDDPLDQPMPAGTKMGHVHLHVPDVEEALRFYHDLVGFDVMGKVPGVGFVSAGGYHHHLVEQRREVEHLQLRARLAHAVVEHDRAERAGDRQRLGARLRGLAHALLVDRPPSLLLHPHPRPARAAAERALAPPAHLDRAADRRHELARLLAYVVVPREVARVGVRERPLAGRRHELALADELGEERGVVHDLVLAAEVRVLVPERVEAVRARRDDLLNAGAVQRGHVLAREALERVLVAHPPGGVAVARFARAEDREVDARLLHELRRRDGRAPRALVERGRAPDPEQDLGRRVAGLEDAEAQTFRPLRAV